MTKLPSQILSVLSVLLFVPSYSLHAEQPFQTIFFEDDFSGDKLGEAWGSWKSETVVRDGVMLGITPETADHPSVNTIQLPPVADLEVAVSFRFSGSNRFNVMFRDLDYEGSHAGHICHVGITPDLVSMYDGKTGMFRKDLREKRKAGEKLDSKTQEMLKGKESKIEIELDPEAWHKLRIRIEGDELKVWIDDKLVGSLKSEGIAHETISNMNITTVAREVHYDDFSIRFR